MIEITILGLGYIGLPTACMFAKHGNSVTGIDINQDVVKKINRGEMHIVEPGLEGLLQEVVANKTFAAFDKVEKTSDVYIIAVPTPFKDNFVPDISYVEAAANSIAPVLKKGDLVIIESTSPVGTTRRISELLSRVRADLKFPHQDSYPCVRLAYCPERILPGKTLEELVSNDRVIGGMTPECAQKAALVYQNFVKGQCLQTTAETAEMAKLTENSFRDVNIAFANELSMICDKLGINVWELISLANRHPRVNILQPGPGVGGHCIAVDPWFIYHKTPDIAKMVRMAREVNDYKPHFVLHKVHDVMRQTSSQTVSFFGLSFKADIDDLRESPAMDIVKNYAENNPDHQVYVVEPHIEELPLALKSLNNIQLKTFDEALESPVAVILVGHQLFVSGKQKLVHHPMILDFQGLLNS
ncbi:UDP-N-acetyl-D-mannosamine dehydrogenase [Candidatus Paracaedibacter symbiosus]|uniref:UDP-N-acetyl-D-mannosamine dehydrogenase n=1 Tax=Candidatus Paracaedibacter symbiosus TaxID=244582 RepID=UPI0005093B34|nr:UDP-N-acetyl-D-mannosamine dehydrogenase [Candidatus Paracaedibacter symbiosus]